MEDGKYREAPALPRYPTALEVPAGGGEGVDASAMGAFVAPPKFPSLSDVRVGGEELVVEGAVEVDEEVDVDVDHGEEVVQGAGDFGDEEEIAQGARDSGHNNPHVGDDSPQFDDADVNAARVGSDLAREIDEVISRDAVVPGEGAARVAHLTGSMWTGEDQVELERLLLEGRDVYVPADIHKGDLTYATERVPTDEDTDEGVSALASKVAGWKHLVTGAPSDDAAAAAASRSVPVAVASRSTPVSAVPAPIVEDATALPGSPRDTSRDVAGLAAAGAAVGAGAAAVASAPTAASAAAPAAASAAPKRASSDVSSSIFGSAFMTVPVRTNPAFAAPEGGMLENDVVLDTPDAEVAKRHEVMLRSDTSAHVNVTDDYGLRGGHANGVNDAAFLDSTTLVTGGNDGKVCVWDLAERVVKLEFVPFEGAPVTMVYPMTDDIDATSTTLMTLSESRLMRIWNFNDEQAVMLRSMQIPETQNDLVMSIPIITPELKARAAAAAAAAAVTTEEVAKGTGPATAEAKTAQESSEVPTAPEPPAANVAADTMEDVDTAQPGPTEPASTEKDAKRFSFTKVSSMFGSLRRNSSSKKAVAS